MLFGFAFRNVMRNRKRSLLTAAAVFFAAVVVTITQAWAVGLTEMVLSNTIRHQTAHMRVVSDEYLDRERFMPVDELVFDADMLIEDIRALDAAASVEERIRFGALLGSVDAADALGLGLDFARTEIPFLDRLVEGDPAEPGIFIGYGLAERTGTRPGDELMIAARTSEGGLNAVRLPVAGIFRYNIGMYDNKLFYLALEDARRLLRIPDGTTTEIYVFARDLAAAGSLEEEVGTLLDEYTVVQGYRSQLGAMADFFDVSTALYMIIEALIIFLASFVVINTMMMTVFERIREIGTLKAIGMTDRQLFFNFTLEGAIIGFIGGTAGVLVGYIAVTITGNIGIDISQVANMELPFEYILRLKAAPGDIIPAYVLSIIIPALAAMIPARRARRLVPADALRK